MDSSDYTVLTAIIVWWFRLVASSIVCDFYALVGFVYEVNMANHEGSSGVPHPKLNERILSSMSRRTVAAHPWHDVEIGTTKNLWIFFGVTFSYSEFVICKIYSLLWLFSPQNQCCQIAAIVL